MTCSKCGSSHDERRERCRRLSPDCGEALTSPYLLSTPRHLAEIIYDRGLSTRTRLNAWFEWCARLDYLPGPWYIPRQAYDVHSNHTEAQWIRLCERVNRPIDLQSINRSMA